MAGPSPSVRAGSNYDRNVRSVQISRPRRARCGTGQLMAGPGMVRGVAIALVCGLLLGAPAPSMAVAAGTAERVEVPISQLRLSDGTIRYAVPVKGGKSGP